LGLPNVLLCASTLNLSVAVVVEGTGAHMVDLLAKSQTYHLLVAITKHYFI
jgi:hypothetical protein